MFYPLTCERYFTDKLEKIQRWGINDNLLGTREYCPIIRKTEALDRALSLNFQEMIEAKTDQFPKICSAEPSIFYIQKKKIFLSDREIRAFD